MSSGPEGRISPFERAGLVVCLLIAIALRGLVIGLHSDELTVDRDAYLAIARCVADGKGFVDPDRLTPTAYRPPLYPIQLAGLMKILPTAWAVATGNLAWGVIAVWATWRAGTALGLGAASLLAALLVAVDPLLLQYSAQPMTEVTCAGLAAMLGYWMVRRDCAEHARHFGLGLLFGMLVVCRPTFWPLAGLILIGWGVRSIAGRCDGLQVRSGTLPGQLGFAQQRGQTAFGRGSTIQRTWFGGGQTPLLGKAGPLPWRIVLGTLVVDGPWVIRNQCVMGSPILMTTHGGYTLLLANNPEFYSEVVDRGWGHEWSQASFDRWQSELQASLADQLGPKASELERDRWQSLRAREFISTEPGRFARAVGYRIRSLWSPVPQGEDSANSRLVLVVGCYYTIVLLVFGWGIMLAVVRMTRLRQFGWWPLIAMVLTVQLVHLAYWTNARMRAPIVPVISLIAVSAACRQRSASGAKSASPSASPLSP